MILDLKESLTTKLQATEIPTDFIRIPGQQFCENQEQFILSKTAWANIETLSKHTDIAPHIILLTTFKLLLFRLTAQKDLFIGIALPERNEFGLAAMPDYTSALFALHTKISGSEQLTDLLAQINQAASEVVTWQDLSSPSIFFCTQLQQNRTASNVRRDSFSPSHDNTHFDIKLCLTTQINQPGEITCILTYNANLYTPQHIREMLRQYHHLLEQIANNPHQDILEYSLVTGEAESVLPDPATPLKSEWKKSIPEMVTDQEHQSPQSIALVDSQNQWTYADLRNLSNKLSNYFIDSGIKKGDVVAVYADRNASLVLAVLSILKAGAAFMILDPAYPPGRLLNQLNQSQPKFFLHLEGAGNLPLELDKYLGENSQISYRQLSNSPHLSANSFLEHFSSSLPGINISPESLAYVAFTSGSTGDPKGILGSHRPLSHFFLWHIETFNFTATNRFSMLSGLAHDPLLRDIFTPLCLGATLYIPDQNYLLDPDRLFNWLKDNGISVIHLTPSLSRVIAARSSVNNPTLPELKYAFFGGEALTHKIVQDFSSLAPNITCVNFYGATETPQAMAYHPVQNSVATSAHERIPLGQGIADVQILILNKNRKLAGIGELGEIFIRTPYLSDGYLGDATLTAEKYLDNPFTNDPLDRLYKTGDLGRYRPDGLIEFAEREDRQIKIRGFRIELAEIEHVLSQLPAIKDCHVLVREDTPDNKRIVAYYRSTKAVTTPELRKFMESYLPSYMIPSGFVPLEEYPRTPNGKIDRRALLSLNYSETIDKHEFIPAQTTIEKRLIEIWQELFGIEEIGTQDDFFDLGGHSILAVQMLIRIRDSFGLEIELSKLFQQSTLAEISRLIESYQQKQTGPSPLPFKSLIRIYTYEDTDLPILFCIHGGGGNILFLQEWKKYANKYKLSICGFQARGVDGVTKPHGSIEEMALDYIQELRELQPKGPYYLAGYSSGGIIALEAADILRKQGEAVPLVILLDSRHPSTGSRRLRADEHFQDFLSNPFAYAFGKTMKTVHRAQTRSGIRQLHKYIESNQPIPLELREIYLNIHLGSLEQKYATKVFDNPVVLFRAKETGRVYDHLPQHLGWGNELNNLVIREIPGDHNDLIREPNVGVLIAQIVDVIKQDTLYPA